MTDHIERAQAAFTQSMGWESGEPTMDHRTNARQDAAVLATLALAEEQRTANLIAERDYLVGLLASVPRMSPEAEVVAERVKAMHATIQDRLGLS